MSPACAAFHASRRCARYARSRRSARRGVRPPRRPTAGSPRVRSTPALQSHDLADATSRPGTSAPRVAREHADGEVASARPREVERADLVGAGEIQERRQQLARLDLLGATTCGIGTTSIAAGSVVVSAAASTQFVVPRSMPTTHRGAVVDDGRGGLWRAMPLRAPRPRRVPGSCDPDRPSCPAIGTAPSATRDAGAHLDTAARRARSPSRGRPPDRSRARP